jgi:bifunctional non-homologous end joining protein LigD
MELRFGIAGHYEGNGPDRLIGELVDDGFDALEVDCTAGFPFDLKAAEALGNEASEAGIRLSAHAPYFASLTVPEDDRAHRNIGALEHTVKICQAMGARVAVAHTGMMHGLAAEELHVLARQRLAELGRRIADRGVALGLENSGTKRNFGTLGDIALLVDAGAPVIPVVDWAHVHAMSKGGLLRTEDFLAVLRFLRESFPAWALEPLHCQFTDNEFGPGGEKRHIPYGQGTLRIGPLVEAASEAGIDLVVISEAHDDRSHHAIAAEARAALRPGAPPLGALERKGLRCAGSGLAPFSPQVEVIASGEAHLWVAPDGTEVRLANLDKPLWPAGYTKGDLVEYYVRIAPALLPHLHDRPMSMHRQPNGIEDEGFYEKQLPSHAPPWVATTSQPSEHRGEPIEFVLASDLRTLVWMANLANIELHPWLSGLPHPEAPSFAVFDLDPFEPITFDDVREVALLIKVALERLHLRGYPKYSGATGMQIYVPLEPRFTYARVRAFVEAVGRAVLGALPNKVTMEWEIPRRSGKVFIDHNMNVGGKTISSVYSLRPVPWCGVSTPVTWEEVASGFEREDMSWGSIFDRLRRFGDLFGPVQSDLQDLEPAEAALGLTPR